MLKRVLVLMTAFLMLLGSAQAGAQEMNLLLIGVDSQDTAGRSDTMMLVRVDVANGRARMVSFLRDLYVRIPGVGKTRLNAAYFYGGEELLKQTLSDVFGVSVDHTITIHFSALSELVDQLGGIEIDITDAERRHLKLKESGPQRLNGQQVLAYSRIRKIDSDFQRTSRQQNVLMAMMAQARELGYWDMLKLALSTLPKVQTDLKFGDIVDLAPLVMRLDELDLQTARVPFDGAFQEETINGMMVLVPNLERCQTLLHDFLN